MNAFTQRRRDAALLVAFALAPHVLFAQTAPAVREPLKGECVLSVKFRSPAPTNLSSAGLEVQINEHTLDMKQVRWPAAFDGTLLTLDLVEGFREGDKVRTRLLPNGDWSTPVTVLPSPLAVSCKQPSAKTQDDRPRLASIALIGGSSETFSPEIDRFQSTFNPSTPGTPTTKHLQLLTEFSLDYRLGPRDGRGLWILSRARYAAQQTSTCTTNTNSTEMLCREQDAVSIAANQAFKNVNNARVAEFTLGLRYEFATLNAEDNPIKLYATLTHGSLFVVKVDDKSLNDIFVGGGLVVTKGRFRDTSVELGTGLSEVFAPDSGRRWPNRRKTNVMLVTDGSAFRIWNPIRFFVRFSLDRAKGPDSFRTSYGGIVDLSRVFGGLSPGDSAR
jgi:hypothetical protein